MQPGTNLAHYTIVSKIGAGGMGEVYRATDSRLGREVALKLLPPHFAEDPERLARFEREARTLASFQHANIASIYGIENDGGHRFLVMELAEGEDLAARLARGPLETARAVEFARQIAEGLEAAHEAGIVHRDLKPANVVLTAEGQIKLLDFGLARAFDGEPETGLPENSPTLTAAFTQPGVILGTAGYMSPEQARGKTVDKRSDIWAFGVILWEMLTGDRLFAGETISDTLAAVLTREPSLDGLSDDVPASVRGLLARCLERDPKNRLRDIGEARLLLADPQASLSMMGTVPAAAAAEETQSRGPARRILQVLPWLLVAALAVLGYGGFLGGSGDSAEPQPVRRFEIPAALPQVYNARAIEISPDGNRIAVFALDGLWIREFDDPRFRLLVPPSELSYNSVGITPFWSPDSRFLAYGAKGRIWKIPADGGQPQVVGTLNGDWMGGTWTDDGEIIFGTSRSHMYRVPARGGDPVLHLAVEDGVELDYHQPSWVWEGGGVIYSVHRVEGVDTLELLRDGVRKVLLRIEDKVRENVQVVNNPVYSPTGHILYQRDQGTQGLWALPFDAVAGEVTGEPFLVASNMGHPSVSRNGLLVHMPLADAAATQFIAVSATGELLEVLTDPIPNTTTPDLSADGTRLIFSARERQNSDIFHLDRTTGILKRLTHDNDAHLWPVWIPGTGRIAYTAPKDACNGVWAMNADGSGQPEFIVPRAANTTFGPEGLDMVFVTRCAKERGLMRFRMDEGDDPVLLREHPAGIENPRLSPDGRWLTYTTWESGEVALEVADFPAMKSRHQVTQTETDAHWSTDGRHLYFASLEHQAMMAADLEPGPGFVIKAERKLFDLEPHGVRHFTNFDVNGDGTEFILERNPEGIRGKKSFTVVENWFEEFRESP